MEFDEVNKQVTHLAAEKFPLVELTVDGRHLKLSSASSVCTIFCPSALLPVVFFVAPGCLLALLSVIAH